MLTDQAPPAPDPRPQTPDFLEARIETIAAGGAGLARVGGKPVFIKGGIPGERLVCRITKDHRSWAQAEALEILEASPDRVQPVCGVYGKCGGCNLQHMAYKAQLEAKTAILKDSFARIGGFSPPEPIVIPSEPWEYRNRMQFHKSAEALWALKSEKSAELVAVPDCPIADPGIRKLLREENKNSNKNILAPLQKDRFTVYSRGDLFLSEGGLCRGKTRILDREITLDASLFFQSNGAMLEKLVTDLLAIAGETDRSMPMADLFCGVGTFAAFLSELFPGASLVEENKAAIALARENLARDNIAPGGDFFAQRSEDWVERNKPDSFSFIVADPPRQGLNQSLALRLASEGPPLLAYVSCDPATLARDGKILTAGKYRLQELRFYDFYPQTAHIESLAVFGV